MNNVSFGERLPPNILFRFHQAQSDLSGLGASHRSRPRDLVFRFLISVLDGDLADLRKAEKIDESRSKTRDVHRVGGLHEWHSIHVHSPHTYRQFGSDPWFASAGHGL